MRPIAFLLFALLSGVAAGVTFTPPATQDDLNNPHKGYMLWGTTWAQGGADNFYGASIYHVYVPWREVETADQVFDWNGFEQHHLQPILAADPQATFVFRLVADYPDGVGSGLDAFYSGGQPERDYPLFLEQAPLNIPGTDYASCGGDGPGRAPAWNHAAFQQQVQQLIAALALRYDGDPRITAIQVGLLGLWGEWHQTGCPQLEPGNAIKIAVRNAYATAFTRTPLQTRYARDPDAVGVDFGFHEDYFPSFTAACIYGFPLCDDSGDWSLEYGYAEVVTAARGNWRHNPLSGESPTTAQKNTWVSDTADVETVLRNYHFSFLGPAGKHEEAGFGTPLAQLKRALGYDFSIVGLTLPAALPLGSSQAFRLDLRNRGSAPLYHAYQIRLELVDGGGVTRASVVLPHDPASIEPGPAAILHGRLVLNDVTPGSYELRLAITSTAAGRRSIRVQNSPRDADGRVVLGAVQIQPLGDGIFADGFSAP